MGISKELEKFLQNEENQKLINRGDKESWEKIYKELPDNRIIGEFTEFLVTRVNIDPAKIIGYIPNYYLCKSNISKYIISNSVTSIGNYAFYFCSQLTNIIIPDSVTSIGKWAFLGSLKLENVAIGNNVKSIDREAFYNCPSLTSVVIPDNVTIIGKAAFANCKSLTSVIIGNSVTSIGEEAFLGCKSLTSVIIPTSVTNIGYYAFKYCSSLTSINYQGIKEEFLNNLGVKSKYWIQTSSIKKIICTDGVIEL